jgi:putative polyketide hydroxylase
MARVDVPVVIVGAGPVGLCAGLFLARQGIHPLVLERHPGTSNHPRARGVGTRTMELFRELNLEEQVRHAGRDLDQSRGWVTGTSLASMNLAEVPRMWDFGGRVPYQEATRYTPSPGIL